MWKLKSFGKSKKTIMTVNDLSNGDLRFSKRKWNYRDLSVNGWIRLWFFGKEFSAFNR
jgi:hypothetical protein